MINLNSDDERSKGVNTNQKYNCSIKKTSPSFFGEITKFLDKKHKYLAIFNDRVDYLTGTKYFCTSIIL